MVDRFDPTRRIFEAMDSKLEKKSFIRYAIVSEVRTEDYKVRVKLLPELVETNWLRVYWLNSGEKYQSGSLPEVDCEVVVMFMEGNPEDGFILSGGFKHDEDTFPADTDHGWNIMDKHGNEIRMNASGVTIISAGGINLGEGGSAVVLENFISLFNGHTHLEHDGPSTMGPVQQAGGSHKSSITKVK